VNAVFLLMSTTLAAGQEKVTEAPPVVPPVIVQPAQTWPSPAYGVPNGGCSSCAVGIAPGCSDPCPCEGRKGLFGRRKGDECDCTPRDKKKDKHKLFHGFTTSACDGSKDRGGLFSHLHARFNQGGDSAVGCDTVGGCGGAAWGGPAIGGCALPPVPSYVAPVTPGVVAPAAPAEAPKPMEKPKDTPKTDGTTNVSLSLPAPTPLPVPPIPVLADKKSPF
jgi:hypothetical protein